MNRPTRFAGSMRLARGTVLGAAAVLITVLGHSAGHGALPEPGLLVLLLPLGLALGTLAAGRRRSGAWILGFVLSVQVLFHLLLTIAAGHGHHGSLLPDTPMLISHLIAAMIIAIALAHGDALVHRWIEFWQALALDLSWTPAPRIAAAAPIATPLHARDSVILEHAIARRGPPVS